MRAAQLDAVCDQLSVRVVDRERELARARLELERLADEREEWIGTAAAIVEELEEVRRQARGQATRIRLRALHDAADLSGRLTELTRRPPESRERLLAALNEAIARIGAEDDAEAGAEALPALRPVGDVFDGTVEVDVGPLDDFSQLVGFEDAAGAIAATAQISVKRFAAGRATLELRLAQPVELLDELERRAPFGFEVRERSAERVVLDVRARDAAAA